MNALQNILAASDLSAPNRHAIARAASVAAEAKALLSILHVAGQPPMDSLRQVFAVDTGKTDEGLLNQARTELRALGETIHQRFGIAPSLNVTAGELLPRLLDYADALPADLIILGARGGNSMRRILLGSTAERLLGTSSLPLLVVKQAVHESYRKLLVPIDFSAGSLRSLKLAHAIAPRAELVVLHAFELPFEGQLRYAGVDTARIEHYRSEAMQQAREKLGQLCEAANLPSRHIQLDVLHGNSAQRILEHEQDENCDLIVIGKRGETLVEEFLLGRVTKHVLAESRSDVLVTT